MAIARGLPPVTASSPVTEAEAAMPLATALIKLILAKDVELVE
jgi:hypothetical protein